MGIYFNSCLFSINCAWWSFHTPIAMKQLKISESLCRFVCVCFFSFHFCSLSPSIVIRYSIECFDSIDYSPMREDQLVRVHQTIYVISEKMKPEREWANKWWVVSAMPFDTVAHNLSLNSICWLFHLNAISCSITHSILIISLTWSTLFALYIRTKGVH